MKKSKKRGTSTFGKKVGFARRRRKQRLPTKPQIQEDWFRAILDETSQTVFSEDDLICSKHFSPDSFTTSNDGEQILKPSAIPFESLKKPGPELKRLKREKSTTSEIQCSVFSCEHSLSTTSTLRPQLIYHPFPSNEDLIEKWKQFCNKEDNDFAKSYICSDHFTDDDFVSKRGSGRAKTLKSQAIPSIYKREVATEEQSELESSNVSVDATYEPEVDGSTSNPSGDFETDETAKSAIEEIEKILKLSPETVCCETNGLQPKLLISSKKTLHQIMGDAQPKKKFDKKMSEIESQLSGLHKKIDLVLENVLEINDLLTNTQTHSDSEINDNNEESYSETLPLCTIEAINQFEVKLEDKDFKRKMTNRLLKQIRCQHLPSMRGVKTAYQLIDKLFNRDILINYSWTGVSVCEEIRQKAAFLSLRNIVQFFYEIVHLTDRTYSSRDNIKFLQNKILKHAKTRASRWKGRNSMGVSSTKVLVRKTTTPGQLKMRDDLIEGGETEGCLEIAEHTASETNEIQ